ncbi:hypothetical protein GCM10027056_30670 [Glaciibacter psychrotolerans]
MLLAEETMESLEFVVAEAIAQERDHRRCPTVTEVTLLRSRYFICQPRPVGRWRGHRPQNAFELAPFGIDGRAVAGTQKDRMELPAYRIVAMVCRDAGRELQ